MRNLGKIFFGLWLGVTVTARAWAVLVASPQFTAINLPTSVALGAPINVSATAVANYSDNSDGNEWNSPDQVAILRIKIDYAAPGGAWTNLVDSLPEWANPNSVSTSLTASTAGTWYFRFQTMDGRPWYSPGAETFFVYSVTVDPPPGPVISSPLSVEIHQGQTVNFSITATGSPTRFTAAPLPAGLTLNSATGLISGSIPANAGVLGNDATIVTSLSASSALGTDRKTMTWHLSAATISGSLSVAPATGVPGQAATFSYSAYANFDVNWVEHTYWRPDGSAYVPGITTGISGSRAWIPDAGPGTYYYTTRIVDNEINYFDLPAISFAVSALGPSSSITISPAQPAFGQAIHFSLTGGDSAGNLNQILTQYQRPAEIALNLWNDWENFSFPATKNYSATLTFPASAVGLWSVRSKAFSNNFLDGGWVTKSFTVQKASPTGSFASRTLSAFGGSYAVTAANLDATFTSPYPESINPPTGAITYKLTETGAPLTAGAQIPLGATKVDAVYAGDANYQTKTVTATFTVNAANDDADGDSNGMADGWEFAHFGRIGVDPSGDADGDGFTNLREFTQKTDPNNPDVTPPSAPSSLQVTAVSKTSVNLAWSASTDLSNPSVGTTGVSGYAVLRDGVQLNALLVSGLSFSDSGLSAGSTYLYTVKAFDLAGNYSALSAPLSVTTSTGTSELVLTVSDATANHANLSWAVPGTVTSFTVSVERATGTGSFVEVFKGADVFNFTDYGLTADQPYSFRIKITPANGTSLYSGSVAARPSAPDSRGNSIDAEIDSSTDAYSYTPILLLPQLSSATDSSLLEPMKITTSGKVLLDLQPTSVFGPKIKYEDYYVPETFKALRWSHGIFEPLKHSPTWQNWAEFTVETDDSAPFWVRRSSEIFIRDMNDAGEVVGIVNTHVSPAGDFFEVYHQFKQPAVWPAGSSDAKMLGIVDGNTSEKKLPDQGVYQGNYSLYQHTPQNTADLIDDRGRIFGYHFDGKFVPGLGIPDSVSDIHKGIQFWPRSSDASSYFLNKSVVALSPDGQHKIISSTRLELDDVPMTHLASGPINNDGRYLSGSSWSERDQALQPLPGLTGTALAINSSHTILGQNAGYTYDLWTWEKNAATGAPFPAGTYHRHPIEFRLPTGMDSVRLVPSMSDSRVLLGTVHRTLDFDGTAAPANRATVPAIFVQAAIAVDANRDGKISLSGDLDVTDAAHPFRFWINDDDDGSGDATGGNDIPSGLDYLTNDITGEGAVRGHRDLVDLFPLYLEIKQLLTALPPSSSVKYKLRQADGAVNFVYTNLTRDRALDYQRPPINTKPLGTGFGVNLVQAPEGATKFRVTAAGFNLFSNTFGGSPAFLDAIQNHNGGVILVEGRRATDKPLVLSVETASGSVLAEVKLEIKISPVETMFRHLNLHDRNLPGLVGDMGGVPAHVEAMGDPAGFPDNPNSTSCWLIFVHGFNVNGKEARGWNAEMFKRCYWSGSKSRFVGVSWFGNPDQVFEEVSDFHLAVRNAFSTAPMLAQEINALPGAASTKTMFAHSLGCGVISSAIADHGMSIGRACFVDAALARECFDGRDSKTFTIENDGMTPAAWRNYDPKLYAANWSDLFNSTLDARGLLSWTDRFTGNTNGRKDVSPSVYNFYSSTEDVLADYTGELPSTLVGIGWVPRQLGAFGWVFQEKGKGNRQNYGIVSEITHLGSNYGGWGFNLTDPAHLTDPIYYYGGGTVFADTQRIPLAPASWSTALNWQAQFRRAPLFDPGYGKITGPYRHVDPSVLRGPPWIPQLYDSLTDTTRGNGMAAIAANRAQLLAEAIPALTWCMGSHPSSGLQIGRNFDIPSLIDQTNWPRDRINNVPEWRHSDIRGVAYRYQYGVFDKIVSLSN